MGIYTFRLFIMNKLIIFLLLFVSTFQLFSQTIGGIKNDYSSSIIEVSDNLFFIVGTTKNNSSKGSDDILAVKIDLNNLVIKSQTFGKNLQDRSFNITKLSNNNLLITGESWAGFNIWGRENAFLLEIDLNFNEIWGKSYYYTARDGGLQAKELSDGNLLLVGYSRSFDIAHNSLCDVFLLKTSNQGDTIWHKAYNSIGNDYGFDFLELDNGNLLILSESGGFRNSNQADYRLSHDADILFIETDYLGNELQRIYWGGEGHDFARKIIKSPDNDGYYIIGSTQSYGAGNFDILLLKIDNNYNEIWHKTYGTSHIDYGESFDISVDNSMLYIIGTTTNLDTKKPQMTVFATDLDGEEMWTQDFSIENLTYGSSIAATADSGCVAVGNTGNSFDNYKIFLSKFKQDGEYDIIFNFNRQVTVYPNPIASGNILNFKISSIENEFKENYTFRIYDSTGKLIFSKTDDEYNFEFNSSMFEIGIYIYNFIFWDNTIISGKFIVD